ncbi:hypothetical protein AHAS_Ahas16G0312700 [Arachis hypogaea]
MEAARAHEETLHEEYRTAKRLQRGRIGRRQWHPPALTLKLMQGLNSGSKRRKLVRNVGKSMSHPVESCAGDEDSPARIIGNEPQVLHQMQQFLRQARQNHGLTTGSGK